MLPDDAQTAQACTRQQLPVEFPGKGQLPLKGI